MKAQNLPPLLLLLLTLLITLLLSTPSTNADLIAPRARAKVNALATPITKDTITSLYTLSLSNKLEYLLDLTGLLLWSPCPLIHTKVICNTSACANARAYLPPGCPRVTIVNSHPCTCATSVTNPVTGECGFGDLTRTGVSLYTTGGRNPTSRLYVRRLVSMCAPASLLLSLPSGAAGVAGLARTGVSLASQFSAKLSFRRQFGICLPSSGDAPGVAFFGNGPFYLLPPPGVDVTSMLQYTPLVKHPTNPGYYVRVKGLAVNWEAVQFLARVLEFDSLGHGGVKISTTVPFTTLTSHVYRPFLKAFAKATSGIRRMPKVKPFDLCLDTRALGSTRMGYGVASIDVMLEGGKNWTIFGANSLVQVKDDTACLAFVDGGKAEQAMVIGGYQMENNFFLFDLAMSRLGFTSSLLGVRTGCSGFNFTLGA